MSHHISSVSGADLDSIPIRKALLSVFDKTGIVDLARNLESAGVEILSTGGTAKALTDAGISIKEVSEYTGSPEILDGRVKTLNPKIHGGLLAVRGNSKHTAECAENDISEIDLLVMILYPFNSTVASGADFATCVENIDIGGPAMLRSSAKNHKYVAVLTSPDQYESFIDNWKMKDLKPPKRKNLPHTTLAARKQYAATAFQLSAQYDTNIAEYFAQQLEVQSATRESETKTEELPSEDHVFDPAMKTIRTYNCEFKLKYGANPHQLPAAVYSIEENSQLNQTTLPFTVLNGTPGYINLMDALYGWQLVKEASSVLNTPVAASYKHCSPAGAALGSKPLTSAEAAAYEISDPTELSPVALSYLRARNADPLCSFGDMAAFSHTIDICTAKLMKHLVCDGIIAPNYEPEALEILKSKKKGAFIVLQGNVDFIPPTIEYRELYGVVLSQHRNDHRLTEDLLSDVVVVGDTSRGMRSDMTAVKEGDVPSTELLPTSARRDLLLASIVIKYTQSNSVGYAFNGQMIGVGAGQQSRVDCVKLAGRKAATWYLRQHPKVQNLPFKSTVRKQDRINARVRYLEGDITAAELPQWLACFETPPQLLTESEKRDFLDTLQGVSLSSDAFFPFRDSIDHASRYGVRYIAQPGGSVADQEVKDACAECGMSMAFTNVRLFLH